MLPLLADGDGEGPIAETFPLERAAEAYERFQAGGKLGKIVLRSARDGEGRHK